MVYDKGKTENGSLLAWLNRSLKPRGSILRLEDTLIGSLHAVSISTGAMLSSINVIVATLKPTVVNDGAVVNGHLRSNIILSITTIQTVRRDENVEEARGKECTNDEDDNHVHEDEAVDERRIIRVVVEELGVCEGEHESHGGTGDVFETKWPYSWDLPIGMTAEDGIVEIATELVALIREVRVNQVAEAGEIRTE
jgi:hypothetical protein